MTNKLKPLFIDDQRSPRLDGSHHFGFTEEDMNDFWDNNPQADKSFDVARTLKEALYKLRQQGCPSEIHFDYYLGGTDTTKEVVLSMIRWDKRSNYTFIPHDFTFVCHSSDPRKNIELSELLDEHLNSEERLSVINKQKGK